MILSSLQGPLTNVHVTRIELTRNGLDHNAIKALCHAIEAAVPSLAYPRGTILVPVFERTRRSQSSQADVALAMCFERHETLDSLCIRENNIADGVEQLAEALEQTALSERSILLEIDR